MSGPEIHPCSDLRNDSSSERVHMLRKSGSILHNHQGSTTVSLSQTKNVSTAKSTVGLLPLSSSSSSRCECTVDDQTSKSQVDGIRLRWRFGCIALQYKAYNGLAVVQNKMFTFSESPSSTLLPSSLSSAGIKIRVVRFGRQWLKPRPFNLTRNLLCRC